MSGVYTTAIFISSFVFEEELARPKKCDDNFRRSYSSHLLSIDEFVGFNWDAAGEIHLMLR